MAQRQPCATSASREGWEKQNVPMSAFDKLLSNSLDGPVALVRSLFCGPERVKGDANLIFGSACSWPDEGVRAQIALDVGGDDLAGDAIAQDKPLVHSRHGE